MSKGHSSRAPRAPETGPHSSKWQEWGVAGLGSRRAVPANYWDCSRQTTAEDTALWGAWDSRGGWGCGWGHGRLLSLGGWPAVPGGVLEKPPGWAAALWCSRLSLPAVPASPRGAGSSPGCFTSGPALAGQSPHSRQMWAGLRSPRRPPLPACRESRDKGWGGQAGPRGPPELAGPPGLGRAVRRPAKFAPGGRRALAGGATAAPGAWGGRPLARQRPLLGTLSIAPTLH